MKRLHKKVKIIIKIATFAIGFLLTLFGSLAFIYPANATINIVMQAGNEIMAGNGLDTLGIKTKNFIEDERISYKVDSMGSREIAGLFSETGQKVLTYHQSILMQQKKESEAKQQSQTVPAATNTSQVAAVADANLSAYENQVLALINTLRAQNGLGSLVAVQSLTNIARSRSADMLARNYFSHYAPEGKNIFNYLRESGIPYSYGGENLAHSTPANAGSPDVFMHAWLSSPTHRANILRAEYTKIGIGVSENGNRRVVTTVFTN
jgi:uncharacterized protein YkwD